MSTGTFTLKSGMISAGPLGFVLATILEATLKTSGSIPAMLLSAACALLLMCAVAQADTGKKTSTSAGKSATTTHKATRKGKRARKTSWRRGQQKIDPKRAREIQEALIREHYMQGNASGIWDQTSQKAMVRYQAENGWQTKTVPDARALIKLGLGPNYSAELLNGPPKASPAATPSTTASRGIEGAAGGKQ